MLARCTNCGAEIQIETEGIFATCSHCKATLFVFSKGYGLRYILRPIIDQKRIEPIIKNFFLKKGYTGTINILSKEAIFFPFYRGENTNDLTPAIYSPDHNLLSKFIFKGGELIFFDEAKITGYRILEPEIEPKILQDNKINLIYYPLIYITYKYIDKEYSLIIDGFSEEIITDILPIQRDTIREKAYIYIFIITSFLLFIEFFAFESILVGLVLSVATIIIIWFIFPFVFRLIEDIYVSEDKNS